MEFITEGGTINCVRVHQDPASGSEIRTIISSFDAQVDRVAPHVAAQLTSDEIKSLELWLRDRAKLQADLENKPIENTILETLPSVIIQASEALNTLKEIDIPTYKAIRKSLESLSNALDRVEPLAIEPQVKLNKMQSSEELKERLDVIRDNLEQKAK